ncbi:hypothetical protein [Haloferula sp.]|uniref:hypothetical protein n=1 Tax=Haloferula sp. TaxID=2497595 RepID=UPI00329C6B60
MKKTLFIIIAGLVTSMAFSSCRTTAGNVAAGAAVAHAIDEKEEEERREDAAWAKYHRNKDKGKNQR